MSKKTGRVIICAICGAEKYYSGCYFKLPHPPKYCSKKCRNLGMIGNKAWNKGKKLPRETRKKISQSKSGENHPNWGRHLSQETKQKISKNNKGKHFDPVIIGAFELCEHEFIKIHENFKSDSSE